MFAGKKYIMSFSVIVVHFLNSGENAGLCSSDLAIHNHCIKFRLDVRGFIIFTLNNHLNSQVCDIGNSKTAGVSHLFVMLTKEVVKQVMVN